MREEHSQDYVQPIYRILQNRGQVGISMNRKIVKTLDDVELKESWTWDIDQMRDDMNALKRKIRLAEKERKEQPYLLMQDALGKYVVLSSYQLAKNEDGSNYLIAGSRRYATPEEIAEANEE